MSELAQNTEVGEGNGAPDGATLVVENPATGEAVRAVPVMHREELTGMVAAARAAQPAWAALTFAERGHVMRRAQRWMISNPQRVLDVVMMGHEAMWRAMQERDRIYADPAASEDDYMRAADLEAEFAEYGGYTAEARAGANGRSIAGLGQPLWFDRPLREHRPLEQLDLLKVARQD